MHLRNALMYLAADVLGNVSGSEILLAPATAVGEVGCFGSRAPSRLKMIVPATRMEMMGHRSHLTLTPNPVRYRRKKSVIQDGLHIFF